MRVLLPSPAQRAYVLMIYPPLPLVQRREILDKAAAAAGTWAGSAEAAAALTTLALGQGQDRGPHMSMSHGTSTCPLCPLPSGLQPQADPRNQEEGHLSDPGSPSEPRRLNSRVV
jgi:hypothetical protein